MRRIALAVAALLTLIVPPIALAGPASAAQVGTITATNGTPNGGQVCHNNQGGSSYSLAQTGAVQVAGIYTFTGASSDTVLVTNNCANAGGNTVGTMYVGQQGTWTQVAPGGSASISLGNGNFGVYGSNVSPNLIQSFNVSISGGGGGGAGGSSSSASPRPSVETLSLAVSASGAVCTDGNPTGFSGQWMATPGQSACTNPAHPSAKLLGWSTSAAFPVAVAQSQVDKGWGAIDGEFDGVRMIFIPAGHQVFVTGSNTLYPVWSV